MRFLALAANGLTGVNGLQGVNGLSSVNGVGAPDGFTAPNGIDGSDKAWNAFLRPDQFSQSSLGDNWINTELLGSDGVGGDLTELGIEDNILDNRFITEDLKAALCQEEENTNGELTFRTYFATLIELGWPRNAKLHVCCAEPAGASAASPCLDPDFVFTSDTPELNGFEELAFAPHFLTEKFEAGQQEALTAALIAKFNTQGKHLVMDLTGRFDLGAAGQRFIAGRKPGFGTYLGNSWGNAFLDCAGEDKDNVLCKASTEEERDIGRDPKYFNLPMFTCSSNNDYPTFESGKACFSKNMQTNIEDGCDFVAAAGPCDHVCVAGFCGVNEVPLEDHGTTNVLYVYLADYDDTSAASSMTTAFIVTICLFAVFLIAVTARAVASKRKSAGTTDVVATMKEDDSTIAKDEESLSEPAYEI